MYWGTFLNKFFFVFLLHKYRIFITSICLLFINGKYNVKKNDKTRKKYVKMWHIIANLAKNSYELKRKMYNLFFFYKVGKWK